MRINKVINNIAFKSGYPTFSSAGHLSYVPDPIRDNVFFLYRPKPTGLLAKEGVNKLNYLV